MAKGATLKSLIGLMNTKSFGAKRRARHKQRKAWAIKRKSMPKGSFIYF